MLNICFGGMAAGSLYHFSKELGIGRRDIACVGLHLHCGDISQPFCYGKRRNVYEAMYGRYAQEIFNDDIISFLKRLKRRKRKVCIWFTKTTLDEYLGLLFMSDYLRDSEIYCCDCTEICNGVGLMQELDELTVLPEKKRLTKEEIDGLRREWARLKAENKPLRVYENGKIVSCDSYHFDDIFYRCIGDEPIRANMAVQKIYGSYFCRNFCYAFVNLRLQELVEGGSVVAAGDGGDEDGVFLRKNITLCRRKDN
ncbi:MAG: DUF3658 domain-containing protein [Ruminiclostridium sp.]